VLRESKLSPLRFQKSDPDFADCIIAGGTESMSLVPAAGWKLSPNYHFAKEHPDYYLNMGLTAEEVAKDYKISRKIRMNFL